MKYTDTYYKTYQNLPEKLVEIYTDLNFDNHCYLRIALDNTLQAKWDTKLKRPAYKNLSQLKLEKVLKLLNQYRTDKEMLLKHNELSLIWRKNIKTESKQQRLWHNN